MPRVGPRIPVYSTNSLSGPGIGLAGSIHPRYSQQAVTIPVPCSGGIRPARLLQAIEAAFGSVRSKRRHA